MKTVTLEKESEFPKLMINDDRTIVIIAYTTVDDYFIGTVVHSEYQTFGRYPDHFYRKKFHDYPGQVILSNHKIDG